MLGEKRKQKTSRSHQKQSETYNNPRNRLMVRFIDVDIRRIEIFRMILGIEDA